VYSRLIKKISQDAEKTPCETSRCPSPNPNIPQYSHIFKGACSKYWVSFELVLFSRVANSYLPASHTEEEAQNIRLLLLLKLFNLELVRLGL